MMIVFPILFLICIYIISRKYLNNIDWRFSLLFTFIVAGLVISISSEIISIFHQINSLSIKLLWIALSILSVFYCICIFRKIKLKFPFLHLDKKLWLEYILSGLIIIIVFIIGFTAWIYPPNTWDSMTYHMSRIMHWIQNNSLDFYPTAILRQLHQAPFAEYAILHLELLSGSDQFSNFVQWASMVGSIIGVSLIAKQLGSNTRGQVFASFLCATIPVGILQGSSTQTDYVLAFWLVCCVSFGLLLKQKSCYFIVTIIGISLGLVCLTKATAYIYAFPFMVWFSLYLLKNHRQKAIPQILLIISLFLLINLGQFTRNYNLYGSPLGPGQETENAKYTNDVYNIRSVFSNIVKNTSLHFGTKNENLNNFFENSVFKFHKLIHFDANSLKTNYLGLEFSIPGFSTNEDIAGNPGHLLLMFSSIFFLFFIRNRKIDQFIYLSSLLWGIIFFALVLKWQPWNSRLHLPLFVIWTPFLGLLLSRIKFTWIVSILFTLLLVESYQFLFHNANRPLIGISNLFSGSRNEKYFNCNKEMKQPILDAVNFINDTSCHDIGLQLDLDGFEYPYWVLLQQYGEYRFEHINVQNISETLSNNPPFNNFSPCIVITDNWNSEEKLNFNGISFVREYLSVPISVYIK